MLSSPVVRRNRLCAIMKPASISTPLAKLKLASSNWPAAPSAPRVLREVGAFGGFFSLQGLPRDAVLVSSMDGVGTKLKLAFALNRHHTVGADLLNHCVNDIAVHGATPLFFLDYLATGKLHPDVVEEIVRGWQARAAKWAVRWWVAKPAEMPGFYPSDEYDLAGCIVGWVKRSRILDGRGIRPGDAILGLPSLGLHTNGYSLARKVCWSRRSCH